MIRLFLALWLVVLSVGAARADVPVPNFTDASLSVQISRKDGNLDHVRIDSGGFYQSSPTLPVSPTHPLYVVSQDTTCGFLWNIASPFCGFAVSSTVDLKRWTLLGHMFDVSTAFWQDRCKGVTGSSYLGCFQPRVIYNAANNNWVLWFDQGGVPGGPLQQPNALFVMTCTTPGGEADGGTCTLQTSPTGILHTTGGYIDFSLFVDDDNSGWIIYVDYTNFHQYIQPLNADYTDPVGPATSTGMIGEGSALFKHSGTYFAQVGGACAACPAGANSDFASASSVQGTYGSPVTINGCNGQSYGTVKITTPGPNDVYLFTTNQFYGGPSQGLVNMYFQPLTFSGSSVVDPGCNAAVVIPGLTDTPFPSPSPTPDQTSYAENKFTDFCFITTANNILQTFVPTSATLSSISLSLAQGCSSNSSCGVDGNLDVSLTTLDGSNNPLATLKSVPVNGPGLSWGTKFTNIPFSYTIPSWSPGTAYGIKLKGNTTSGCYASTRWLGLGSNPYPAGVQKYSTDGGSTWTPQTVVLMFSTFSNAVAGGGRRGGLFR